MLILMSAVQRSVTATQARRLRLKLIALRISDVEISHDIYKEQIDEAKNARTYVRRVT